MLIFRVETCVSLISNVVNVNAGIGPYGTRDGVRNALRRGTYEMSLTGERHELICYVQNRRLFDFCHTECKIATHPAPTSDEKLMKSFDDNNERMVIRGYTFGFESIEQLKNWFSEEARKRLHIAGYYVAIYETEHAHVGDTQCVFKRENAELVDFLSCIEV